MVGFRHLNIGNLGHEAVDYIQEVKAEKPESKV